MQKITIFIILVMVLVIPSPAYAYLDPGTGSLVLQLLLGGVAGVLAIVNLYWSQMQAYFSRKAETPSKPDTETEQEDK